jgi:hypothetical protein
MVCTIRGGETWAFSSLNASEGQSMMSLLNRRILTFGIVLGSLAISVTNAFPSHPEAAEDRQEYDIKAAFLINFARFTVWPDSAFSSPTAPLVLGIYGVDPFDRSTFDEIAKKPINGRRLEVRRIQSVSAIEGCHFLFINGVDDKTLSLVIDFLRNKPVLTVGESAGFQAAGGMIRFLVEAEKVRFEINLKQAARARLEVSSKLLALAKTIR